MPNMQVTTVTYSVFDDSDIDIDDSELLEHVTELIMSEASSAVFLDSMGVELDPESDKVLSLLEDIEQSITVGHDDTEVSISFAVPSNIDDSSLTDNSRVLDMFIDDMQNNSVYGPFDEDTVTVSYSGKLASSSLTTIVDRINSMVRDG